MLYAIYVGSSAGALGGVFASLVQVRVWGVEVLEVEAGAFLFVFGLACEFCVCRILIGGAVFAPLEHATILRVCGFGAFLL